MPRIARGNLGGVLGHVVHRGNGRQTVFHTDDDYAAFVDLVGLARERTGASHHVPGEGRKREQT